MMRLVDENGRPVRLVMRKGRSHKYISRKRVNGKWVYKYPKDAAGRGPTRAAGAEHNEANPSSPAAAADARGVGDTPREVDGQESYEQHMAELAQKVGLRVGSWVRANDATGRIRDYNEFNVPMGPKALQAALGKTPDPAAVDVLVKDVAAAVEERLGTEVALASEVEEDIRDRAARMHYKGSRIRPIIRLIDSALSELAAAYSDRRKHSGVGEVRALEMLSRHFAEMKKGDSMPQLTATHRKEASMPRLDDGYGNEVRLLIKARGHKYIKRTGSPGNYSYTYAKDGQRGPTRGAGAEHNDGRRSDHTAEQAVAARSESAKPAKVKVGVAAVRTIRGITDGVNTPTAAESALIAALSVTYSSRGDVQGRLEVTDDNRQQLHEAATGLAEYHEKNLASRAKWANYDEQGRRSGTTRDRASAKALRALAEKLLQPSAASSAPAGERNDLAREDEAVSRTRKFRQQSDMFKGERLRLAIRTRLPMRKSEPDLTITPHGTASFTIDRFTFAFAKAASGVGVVTITGQDLPLPFHMVAASMAKAMEMAPEVVRKFCAGRTPEFGVFRRLGFVSTPSLGGGHAVRA